MSELTAVFARLAQSTFRRRFHLGPAERAYLEKKGLDAILGHGMDFIEARLGPAFPVKDGKQTPMRGHPVFVAQHATATCCRGCLAKWHAIPKGCELTTEEQYYILRVIAHWLRTESGDSATRAPESQA